MLSKFTLLLLNCLSRTPLGFNRWLGKIIGTIHWHTSKRVRHVSSVNLELCFPEQSAEWRQQTGKAGVINMATTILEAPVLWRLPKDKLISLCENIDAFDDAVKDQDLGEGILLATPHLGNWEFAGLIYASLRPVTFLYRPPKLQAIDAFVQRGRMNTGATLATTDATGVKKLVATLRHGGGIGLLPDQEANAGSGVFTPYFATQAYSMTLMPKMAQRRNSPAYIYFMERTATKPDYRLHAVKISDEIYSKDMITACTAVNAAIEELIRRKPEQYNWAYKRFNETPGIQEQYNRYKS